MISFSIHHCYIKVFLKTLLLCIFMDILYSMFIPTRFILCNKLTEMVRVSYDLFSIHGNLVSFNQDKLNGLLWLKLDFKGFYYMHFKIKV